LRDVNNPQLAAQFLGVALLDTAQLPRGRSLVARWGKEPVEPFYCSNRMA
jgi:hypothetical protein